MEKKNKRQFKVGFIIETELFDNEKQTREAFRDLLGELSSSEPFPQQEITRYGRLSVKELTTREERI